MSELVRRLREYTSPALAHEAADRIEALQEQVRALEAALRKIETICTESAGDCRKRMGTRVGNTIVAARAALAPEQDK